MRINFWFTRIHLNFTKILFQSRYSRGRKVLCLLYPIALVSSCMCILYNDLSYLVLGRIFGGISTSLLYSVFETWMMSEYTAQSKFFLGFKFLLTSIIFLFNTLFEDYPTNRLNKYLSHNALLNSLVAIVAGLISNGLFHSFGTAKSPFILAMIPSILAFGIIFRTWKENVIVKKNNRPSLNINTFWKTITSGSEINTMLFFV